MNKLETCKIEYLGFSSPETPNELNMEILGLKHCIAFAKERIASLRQGLAIAEVVISENSKLEEK